MKRITLVASNRTRVNISWGPSSLDTAEGKEECVQIFQSYFEIQKEVHLDRLSLVPEIRFE